MTENPSARWVRFNCSILVISCHLSYLLIIGSHSVTEMKINRGKIWNPPGFSWCCLSRSVGLTERNPGLTECFQRVSWGKAILAHWQACALSLSLSPSAVATWICGRVNWTGRITSVLQNHFLSAVNTSASHWRVGWCRVRAVAYRAQLLPLSAAYRASTSKRNTIYLQWMHRFFVM